MGKSTKRAFILFCLFYCNQLRAQDTSRVLTVYRQTFDMLDSLESVGGSFKDAVFAVENAYFDDHLDRRVFDQYIYQLKKLCLTWSEFNKIKQYHFTDSLNFQYNFAIYSVLKDTIKVYDTAGDKFFFLPYTYDFTDYDGEKNWANMFISKLLITHSGNCHSLPFLYKILADELGANCWLALAPNHIYIKNRSDKIGWYNTELTSGFFPVDGWIMASGYLPLHAIQSRIYMDTLGRTESIALCFLDLAKGYEHKTNDFSAPFILRCCQRALTYFPQNIEAMLLQAETTKRIYTQKHIAKDPAAPKLYSEMEAMYTHLYDLGYREMPEKMYLQWLNSLKSEKEKYQDKHLNQSLPGR